MFVWAELIWYVSTSQSVQTSVICMTTYSMGTVHVSVLTSVTIYSSLVISFRLMCLLMTDIHTALTVLLNTALDAYNRLSFVTLHK